MDDLTHWKRFKPEERLIQEFGHWLIVVRPKQVTLGDCVILLKRPTESLANLTDAEATELPKVIQWFESRLKNRFQADRFNYVSAMMKDPYVHIHAFPRYSSRREFHGITWDDAHWPAVIRLDDIDTSDEIIDELVITLRENTIS